MRQVGWKLEAGPSPKYVGVNHIPHIEQLHYIEKSYKWHYIYLFFVQRKDRGRRAPPMVIPAAATASTRQGVAMHGCLLSQFDVLKLNYCINYVCVVIFALLSL